MGISHLPLLSVGRHTPCKLTLANFGFMWLSYVLSASISPHSLATQESSHSDSCFAQTSLDNSRTTNIRHTTNNGHTTNIGHHKYSNISLTTNNPVAISLAIAIRIGNSTAPQIIPPQIIMPQIIVGQVSLILQVANLSQ